MLYEGSDPLVYLDDRGVIKQWSSSWPEILEFSESRRFQVGGVEKLQSNDLMPMFSSYPYFYSSWLSRNCSIFRFSRWGRGHLFNSIMICLSFDCVSDSYGALCFRALGCQEPKLRVVRRTSLFVLFLLGPGSSSHDPKAGQGQLSLADSGVLMLACGCCYWLRNWG